MIDLNNKEITAGALVKRSGYVQYADGRRHKISKKTWRISRVEKEKLYYKEILVDTFGVEVENEVELRRPKDEGNFLVVGDSKGFFKEYAEVDKIVKITLGSVGEIYKVLKDVTGKNWKAGEYVKIHGKVSFETLEKGILEKVDSNTKHQHVLVVVDPVKILGIANQIN